MSYESRIKELHALKEQLGKHRKLLFKLRKHLLRHVNCPFCGEADFDLKDRKRIVNGQHTSECFYDELMNFEA